MTETEILERIKNSYQDILGDQLIGIYVHGSIAFRCFRCAKSDIDFLVVVNQSPSLEEKKKLIRVLLELDPQCPPKGFEMSVVLEEVCTDFQYPTPFELHFSNFHKERCRAGLEEYCRTMNGTDSDLAAHFTVVRKVGIVLCGKDIPQVFGPVPKADYMDSIRGDIEDAANTVTEDPVYVILNLCRVLAYQSDGSVLSKEQGGAWGLENLPCVFHPVIESALRCYRGEGPFTGDEKGCRNFAAYMLGEIFK